MQKFGFPAVSCCGSRKVPSVTMLFLLSFLSFSVIKSREIRNTDGHAHVQPREDSIFSDSVEIGDYPDYPQIPDDCVSTEEESVLNSSANTSAGYISNTELNKIVKCFAYRENISRTLDQVSALRPTVIPQCTLSGYVYDTVQKACGKPCTGAHCEGNMILKPSADLTYGACSCISSCNIPCWETPLIRMGNMCYKVATRGPCPPGQILIPLDRQTVNCGRDACRGGRPKNAINFSTLSHKATPGGHSNQPFEFTFMDECYMTETQAFCGMGQIARFFAPYKSPFCVPRDFEECRYYVPAAPYAGTTTVEVPCGPGLVEDRARNFCVPAVEFD